LRFSTLLLAVVVVAQAGCGPFSHRSEPTELFPADSASRALASTVQVETLLLDGRYDGGEGSYYGSVQLGPDSLLWIGDLGRGAIRRFRFDGSEESPLSGFSFPYLSGEIGEHAAVFDAGRNRVTAARDTSFVVDLPERRADNSKSTGLTRQVATLEGGVYIKDSDPPRARLERRDIRGGAPEILDLPGPAWHHRGMLYAWKDRLIDVSSYRPVVYVIDGAGAIDSLQLNGFDSPMLARIRAYSRGAFDEPPLVISGVYGDDESLYVLNLRPGYVRIDVFDTGGRLRRILQHEEPEPTAFTPLGLIVRSQGDTLEAYVVSVNTVYGSLSLTYASRLDRFVFPDGEDR